MRARSVFPHGVVVSVLVVSGTYLDACQSARAIQNGCRVRSEQLLDQQPVEVFSYC